MIAEFVRQHPLLHGPFCLNLPFPLRLHKRLVGLAEAIAD